LNTLFRFKGWVIANNACGCLRRTRAYLRPQGSPEGKSIPLGDRKQRGILRQTFTGLVGRDCSFGYVREVSFGLRNEVQIISVVLLDINEGRK
jgi:hypothetical protein